jgi:peptide/nickel transport system substrate-binding protein
MTIHTQSYRSLRAFWFALLVFMIITMTGCAVPTQPTAPGEAAAPAAEAPATEGEISRAETLIFASEGDNTIAAPENFNPFVSGSVNAGNGQSMMVESLFYLNYETGEMMPWLAESYQFADDFTSVDLVLREGITWSDGEAFNADDIVFTVNMLKDESLPFNWGGDMRKWVANVEAVDEQTVRFTFTGPNPRFLQDYFAVRIYDAVVIVPEHIWRAVEDKATFTYFDKEKGYPIFTGPYQVAASSTNEIIYDRRESWWAAQTGFQPMPAPRRVIYTSGGSADVVAARLLNNELDAVHRVAADVYETIKAQNPNLGAWFAERPYAWLDPCPRTYFINNLKAPWDNVNMRRALSLAIDRQAIAAGELGLDPGGAPAAFIFPDYPPLLAYYAEAQDLLDKYQPTKFDPEAAIALIEGEGWSRGTDGIFEKDGDRLTLTWYGPADWVPGPRTFPLFELFFKNVGIEPTAELLASAVLNERRNLGDYDVILTSPCGSVVDPYRALDRFHSRDVKPIGETVTTNISRYANPAYDAIVDEIAKLAPGDPAIIPLWRQAFEIYLQDQPALPLHQQVRVVPHNTTYWTNWPTSENNYIHPPTWWQTTLIQVVNLKPAQ